MCGPGSRTRIARRCRNASPGSMAPYANQLPYSLASGSPGSSCASRARHSASICASGCSSAFGGAQDMVERSTASPAECVLVDHVVGNDVDHAAHSAGVRNCRSGSASPARRRFGRAASSTGLFGAHPLRTASPKTECRNVMTLRAEIGSRSGPRRPEQSRTPRTRKGPAVQGLSVVGETGFEPATARPPASARPVLSARFRGSQPSLVALNWSVGAA